MLHKKQSSKFVNCEGKLHKGTIWLGVPYIQQMNDNKVRLCSDANINGEKKQLYFEVDKKWEKYLVTEYSDPFVLAVIKKAMKHSWDIHFEQPMSESLHYNLTSYMIPVYARNFEMFHEIDLLGDVTDYIVPSENRAGTGFSAGVDSFYSVLKHLNNEKYPNMNVTHLLLAVNGSASTGVSEELDKEWLESSEKKFRPYAEEMGLELITIASNVDLIYVNDQALFGEVIITSAFIYTLRKLFSIYYWASTYPAEILGFDKKDAGWTEPLSTKYISIQDLEIYHCGSETNRVGKVEFIADFPIVQKGLTVCGEVEAINCGSCVKCLRTMAELTAVKKLDLFHESFPVEFYKKHFISKLAEEIAIDHPPFTTDILDAMKANGIKIPFIVYPLAYLWYKPIRILRGKLKHITFLRKLYYKFDLDLKLGGRKQSEKERERKLNGKFKG